LPRPSGRRGPGARRGLAVAAGVALAVAAAPGPAAAWPAVRGPAGLHLCQTRPQDLGDGRWACRSGGVTYEGDLVDVIGPYGPAPGPGYRDGTRGPAPVPPPYWGPWGWGPGGRPRGPESGYDELDPWLRPGVPPPPDR
jgi:hypothetical protein